MPFMVDWSSVWIEDDSDPMDRAVGMKWAFVKKRSIWDYKQVVNRYMYIYIYIRVPH